MPIPYFIDINVNISAVEKSINFIQKETCIQFKKYHAMISEVVGIRFWYGPDCSSNVGKKFRKKWQNISLGKGCDHSGQIQHEILHTLGFYHEHSRIDRDKYLKIYFQNIIPSRKQSFDIVSKKDSNTFGVPYDYGSVMHYGLYYFTKNRGKTMKPFDSLYDMTPGPKSKMSFADIKMLNIYYCKNICRKKIICFHYGYQNPNNCGICKCIEGYSGPQCKIITPPSYGCIQSQFMAKNTPTKFEFHGAYSCTFHFLAYHNRRILIEIISTALYPNHGSFCLSENSLEIKFWKDKTVTGALFCMYNSNITIISHSSSVIIHYRSNNPQNRVILMYKSVKKSFDPTYKNPFFLFNFFKKQRNQNVQSRRLSI
ncbi:Astacin-like metalloendopeptidase [Strongyloides ratti]|uniref:Metalloendopeptidase n=1 Tax=Strongyloides ratti TaxID=34506 RepID=A0A090LSN3_STRRB|nr:Astacin-like metalloendopeptidase [Strongyloides ratti]CEF70618.1 Astacin-like metalloendopeptidase [Strongyloides ratti]